MRRREVTLPGFVDPHVHLRFPGGEHKETFETGTAAALAGGYVCVLGMPNTQPPVSDAGTLAAARKRAASGARCDVGLYLGAAAHNQEDIVLAASNACGLKIYINETFGTLRLDDLGPVARHFATWPKNRPLVVHAEGLAAAAAIGLAASHGRPVHIAHVSRKSEIEAIRAAKEAGLPVTCEVSPQHLFLTEDDARALGGFGSVRPPLASTTDVEALWENLAVVDCIATDHAPHSREEKRGESPPPGMPGLETAAALMLDAVEAGRLDLDRCVDLLSTAPATLFGVTTSAEAEVTVVLGEPWTVPEAGFQTKADWSPFAGMRLKGRVLGVTVRGEAAFRDGEVLAQPGEGRVLSWSLEGVPDRKGDP